MNNAAVVQVEEQPLFQVVDGGAVPTSPLQFKVKLINKLTARNFYKKWHYLKDKDFLSTYNFGAYFEGYLVGVISFGVMSAHTITGLYSQNSQDGWWEIKRLAMNDGCPKNSESRLIRIGVKLLREIEKVKGIITYADTAMGHKGTIYKASNFEYKGLTDPKTDYMVGDVNWGAKRNWDKRPLNGEWVKRSRKHLFVKTFA